MYKEYSYDEKNRLTEEVVRSSLDSFDQDSYLKHTYKYGGSKTPLAEVLGIPHWFWIKTEFYFRDFDIVLYNVISREKESKAGGCSSTEIIEYNYTYDEEGYPVSMSVDKDENGNYSLECTILYEKY